jgi:hypothetical protein
MTGKNQWVVQRENGWAVRGEGNNRDTSHHSTQQEAIDAGRGIAQNQGSELLIQNRHGQIRERNSYGDDPFPPKG